MAQNQPNRKSKSNTLMIVSIVIGTSIGLFISQSGLIRGGKNSFLVILLLLGLFFAFIGWVFISSMKKTPKATQEEDREAKKFLPVSDKGVVYIFRDQFIAMAKAFPVIISGQPSGWIKGKMFTRIELPAGQYTISGDKACKETADFSLENGQILFIEQEVVAGALKGGYAYNILEDNQDIRARLSRCRLIKKPS